MLRILIGICSTREDTRFLGSFNKFWGEALKKYDITVTWQYNKKLPDAQNAIAGLFLDGRYDYLLLLDDDHSGHTVEMLDCLVDANTNMATMRTFSRHYPYVTAAWNYINENTTVSIECGDGYVKCDLTGFPMTLISRETFNKLEEPYFRYYSDGERDWHSDVDFCKRLRNIGIKPIVCFQYCLNHDKITLENVNEYRHKEIAENNGQGWMRVIEEQLTKCKA